MTDVSVVMPTWNRARFLPAALESVFAQTVPIREIIIADDGSDAPTRMMLEKYAAMPGVHVLWRSHCGNPGALRNAAIREASGRYIAFMDSDDIWLPQKLERQLAALGTRPELRWSYTAVTFIDGRGQPTSPPGDGTPQAHAGSLVERLATLHVDVALPSVLAERALLFQAGLFDENLGCYEDYDLWLRLAMLAEGAAIPEALVSLRQHDEHFSRRDPRAALSGRVNFLSRALRRVDAPAIRAELRRMRALDLAQLANLSARSGHAGDAAHCLRSSLADGWSTPRWWIMAARTHSHLWNLRARRRWEQWW